MFENIRQTEICIVNIFRQGTAIYAIKNNSRYKRIMYIMPNKMNYRSDKK